jgi:hypothetical protein
MKMITFLFLLLFSLVQVAPAFIAHLIDSTSVLLAEEKNGEEKNEGAENKVQKYFSQFANISEACSSDLNTAFHEAEKKYSSPCLEKLTPPPDFY